MRTRNQAIERVAKLWRLATSSNPHEAESALRMADKLRAEYSIPVREVEVSEGVSPPGRTPPAPPAPKTPRKRTPRAKPKTTLSTRLYNTASVDGASLHLFPKRHERWLFDLAQHAAAHNACAAYLHARSPRRYSLELVGEPEDVGRTRVLFAFLLAETEQALAPHASTPPPKRDSFCHGLVEGLGRRLQTQLERAVSDLLSRGGDAAALAQKLKNRELSLHESRAAAKAAAKPRVDPRDLSDGLSFLDGILAAQRIPLPSHDPLGG